MCWLEFQEHFWRNQLSEAQACAALVSRNPTAFWLACKPFHDRITSPYMAASGCWMDWAGIYPERFQFVGTGWQKLNSEFFSLKNLQYQDIGKGSITGSAMDRIKIRTRENNILPGIFHNVCIWTEIERNTKYGISASWLECSEKSRSSETFSFSWKVRS